MAWAENNHDTYLEIQKKKNKNYKELMYNNAKKQRESGQYRKWQQENPDKIKEYQSKRRMNKKHEFSDKDWERCLNYFSNSCAYCGLTQQDSINKYNQVLHKEHVDHNGSNDLSNNVPACKLCNSSKWAHDFNDWYNENNEVFRQERLDKILLWIKSDYKDIKTE